MPKVSVNAEVERKIVHVVLCLLLLSLYLIRGLPRLEILACLALAAASMNALILKQPLLGKELRIMLRERRRKVLESIKAVSPPLARNLLTLEAAISKLEEEFERQIAQMEREYEKVGGYVGLTHGLVGVLVAEALFGERAVYGVIALLTVDAVAALIGLLRRSKLRLPGSLTTIDGLIAGVVTNSIVLAVLGVDLEKAVSLSIILALTEAYAPEDNLLLPPVGGLLASIMSLPPVC